VVNNLSQELANFVVATNWEDLPSSVVRDVKYLLLDTIGCALAAIITDKGKMVIALARRMGGTAESSIIGMGDKISCISAAMANGELMSTVDYDVVMPGGHTTTFIIPPSLALAESVKASGKDLILANAIGYEISARISGAISRPLSGFDGPELDRYSIFGRSGQALNNFGAAAGAGKILKLDRDKMLNALGIAGHLCQVLTTDRFTDSPKRPLNKYAAPGWQDTGAVMAALWAEMGYSGDTTVLNPENGFWKFCGYADWHAEKAAEGLGKAWTFNNIKYKRYPCCGMLHTALDCLYSIIDQNNLLPEEIQSIKAFCHPTVEFPAFTNREVANIVDAQFNAAYVFAAAANKVRIGIEWQEADAMTNPKILEFMKKITCQAHPNFGKVRQKDYTSDLSKVEVAARGKKFTEEKTHFKWATGANTQITEAELVEKFKHNASRILTQNKANEAVNAILNLENLDNVTELTKIVTL
jgi:2-methylcitrate dehydratase PrpD